MFPGSGHIFLKKYLFGLLYIGIATGASLVLFISMMKRANIIADQIVSQKIPFSITTIIDLVTAAPSPNEAQLLNISINIFLITWLVSTIDAYLAGKKIEREKLTTI
jgi:flagellar biosynthesis protein FliR